MNSCNKKVPMLPTIAPSRIETFPNSSWAVSLLAESDGCAILAAVLKVGFIAKRRAYILVEWRFFGGFHLIDRFLW